MQIVRATAGDVDFRPLHVFWGHGNTGASHSSCQDKSIIRLGGAENENTDEYDRSVIAHEWSHYLHAGFSRNDTLSGPHNPLYDHLEIATAFSEGLASALGAVVSGDSAYTNTFGPQQGVTEGFSVENTTHTGRGWFIEASIAQIVYDLIDPVNDDTVELGFGQILEVLTEDLNETRSLTSIFSFIHELKNRVPDYAPAIDSILAYHRIQPIEVLVEVVPPLPLSYVSVEVYAYDGLIVSPLNYSVTAPPAGEAVERTLVVTPYAEGALRLALLVSGDAYGETRYGQLTVPILLGEPRPDPAVTDRLRTTPEGEMIISLPASED